ncbi:MAG TPA: LysM domain-containing protein [Kofleriaceae bacterium]
MKSLAIVIALAATAHAQEAADVSYRVKQGDTIELVAAEFYGDHAKTAVFIAEENKLKPPYKIYPGERLKVPVTREIATSKGDNFASLAAQWLGDDKRAPFLADANHMQPTDALPTGTVLVVPFAVAYVAQGSEPLVVVATAFYGDPKQAEALRAYNGLDRNALDKGESILIPSLHVRTRSEHAPTLDADGAQRHEQQKHALADAQAALPIARADWREGDFAHVRSTLAPIAKRLDYLDTKTLIDVGVLLGKADVAFEDKDAAIALFQEVRARAPSVTLSAYAESPKVLDAWRAANGAVQ